MRPTRISTHEAVHPGIRPGRLTVGQAAWIFEKFHTWSDTSASPGHPYVGRDASASSTLMTRMGPDRGSVTTCGTLEDPRGLTTV